MFAVCGYKLKVCSTSRMRFVVSVQGVILKKWKASFAEISIILCPYCRRLINRAFTVEYFNEVSKWCRFSHLFTQL